MGFYLFLWVNCLIVLSPLNCLIWFSPSCWMKPLSGGGASLFSPNTKQSSWVPCISRDSPCTYWALGYPESRPQPQLPGGPGHPPFHPWAHLPAVKPSLCYAVWERPPSAVKRNVFAFTQPSFPNCPQHKSHYRELEMGSLVNYFCLKMGLLLHTPCIIAHSSWSLVCAG